MSKDIFEKYISYEIESRRIDGKIKKNMVKDYERRYGDGEDAADALDDEIYPVFMLTECEIQRYKIPKETVNYSQWNIDDDSMEQCEHMLKDLIGRHPKYLVCANGCKWRDNSGYTFCDDINYIYTRYNYGPVCFFLEEEGRYAIKGHDYSGSEVIVVGLSYDEYDELKDKDYNEIITFAQSNF